MPTFGSLFSGIGGFDLGLERAGWECKWQVEIDEWCRRVLARHWPDVPRWGDIKDFLADSSGEQDRGIQPAGLRSDLGTSCVDLICGGFPCQPVSLAGKRLAQDDERWLWPEFARIVRLLRPRYVLVENVPGLLARGMGDVLGDLAASGYDTEWDCIPAAAVGAPHLRYRVFVVAHARRVDGEPGPWSTFPLDETTSHHRERRSWWSVEPDVGRVANGVPHRVDRLRGLGNAVVPQVAEWIGRRLMEAYEAAGGEPHGNAVGVSTPSPRPSRATPDYE